MTLHSNTRWCSDGFELHCFNGEKVCVAFSLDCKDREAICFVAKDRPLQATDIRDLMRESVLNRFKDVEPPHKMEWHRMLPLTKDKSEILAISTLISLYWRLNYL
jgi:putative transposase